LVALESVDGGLIGRASLDISEFVSICKAATPITN
jgi:triosephosphate isomerase